MEIKVMATGESEGRGVAKVVFMAHNYLDCVELGKLHETFASAEHGGRDTYIDFDNTEYGTESGGIARQMGGISIKKLTLIIGGGLIPPISQQMVKGAYAFARKVQGIEV